MSWSLDPKPSINPSGVSSIQRGFLSTKKLFTLAFRKKHFNKSSWDFYNLAALCYFENLHLFMQTFQIQTTDFHTVLYAFKETAKY